MSNDVVSMKWMGGLTILDSVTLLAGQDTLLYNREDLCKWGFDSVSIKDSKREIVIVTRTDDGRTSIPKSLIERPIRIREKNDVDIIFHYVFTDTTLAFVAKEMLDCQGIDVWRKR